MAEPASCPRLLLLLPSTTYRATAFVEAARRLDLDLTVATDHTSVFAAREPERLVTFDFAHPERAVEQARAFAARHPVRAVVGVDDDTVVVAAAIAAALGLPHNPVEAARAARDKHRQRVLHAERGVNVPASQLHALDEDTAAVARAAPYPCVLKPTCLSASRGVIRADSPSDFVAAHARLARILSEPEVAALGTAARHYLVEAFVPGPEVALEGVLDGGRLHVLALFDKPDPLNGPYFEETIYVTPSRLAEAAQRAIGECAGRAAEALGLVTGPVHAELRWTDRPWLIEMAARPIGGRCSRVLRFGPDGISLEELLLRQAAGLSVPSCRREAQPVGVMMIPTPGAGVLRAVRGLDEARAVPGIEGIELTAHPGQRLVPLPEGSQYPGFIFARSPSPEECEAALRRAHACLAFDLEPE
ncbi:MAG: ATP-grasp domain-containing protein [Gemmatimonadales bacterium]